MIDGKEEGPLSVRRVRKMLAQRRLSTTDLARLPEMGDWRELQAFLPESDPTDPVRIAERARQRDALFVKAAFLCALLLGLGAAVAAVATSAHPGAGPGWRALSGAALVFVLAYGIRAADPASAMLLVGLFVVSLVSYNTQRHVPALDAGGLFVVPLAIGVIGTLEARCRFGGWREVFRIWTHLAALVGCVMGISTLFTILCGGHHVVPILSIPLGLIDVAIALGLAYGVLRDSRACAVLLLADELGSGVLQYRLGVSPFHAAFVVSALVLTLGVAGSFALKWKRASA